ncbi:MAG: hypothetical protein V4819_19320 [Verrucomicrobiota bacterium]
MNATIETDMSKPLTHVMQHAILSKCLWSGEGKMRVQCTHRTEPLLRKAGVHDPKPLQEYEIKVRREESGLLVINPYAGKAPIVETSDDSLFEAGGLFAGDPPAGAVNVIDLQAAVAANRPQIQAALAPEMAELCQMTRTRTFEVTTDSHQKIRVQVIAFDDEALPSPGEREKWTPRKASNVQIHAAIAALHMARDLAHFEQV